MIEPKFLIRSDEDFYEFNLSYCGRLIKGFKKTHFKKTQNILQGYMVKVFFPPDCREKFWLYYLVFEVNSKPYQITSITNEAFDTLTRGIEPTLFASVEFYTIEKHELQLVS